ncbi:putative receptor-like protein kinase [Hibiscus syriacus]|uniref:non-specific serine/threonine protein kinase n=1 Tax=Hibiscus syriacus TaxID=106335 RepID=A0A6A3CJM9_HIBSY|nr:probable receptor-like protein kinase At1g33260 [Hibiscus syriacus]KAE8727349.1 putative receptor-like protein kinase [Hibiscus syriacus]
MGVPMDTCLATDKYKVTRQWILCVSKFVCWYRWCCRLVPSIFLLLPSPLTVSAASSDPPIQSHVPPQIDIIVTLFLVLVLALLFAMGFMLKFLSFRKLRLGKITSETQPEQDEGKDLVVAGEGFVRKFKWEEIKDATRDFSVVIGQGGFSNVYLANLSGSRQGAVKVHVGTDRLNQAFKQELDILLRLRHDNIVKLLGYSDDLEEVALVFEYIPNGNLQEKLHERNKEVLPWRTRTAIAYQLARAIEFLHEKCSLQIIHGDIKASNILLDEHFNCKLCDFGSAKMGFSSTVMPPSSSTMKHVMIGSPGYTDPHYLRTGLASKKNDVYSLGVIILELVTGMEAFCPEKGQLLTSILAPKLVAAGEVAAAVDPRLGGEFKLEEVNAMVSIAARCLHQSPTVRPSASQITQLLKEKIVSINFSDCQK